MRWLLGPKSGVENTIMTAAIPLKADTGMSEMCSQSRGRVIRLREHTGRVSGLK
jgi:hypothetical protein